MQKGTASLRADIMDVLRETNRNETEFIGLNVAPLFNVERESGTFSKIDADNLIAKVGGGKVAKGSKYQRDQREVTTDTYATVKYGGEEPIPIEDSAELDNYFDVEADTAAALWAAGRLQLEVDLAAALFDDTTNFASYKTDGSDWSTAASGTPIDDIRAAVTSLRTQVRGLTGGAKIIGVVNAATLDNAAGTAQVRAALDYAGNGFNDRDAFKAALARATGLSEIYDSTLLNSAGTAVWTANKFGIYLVGEGSDLRSRPQCARVFNWTRPMDYNSETEIADGDGLVVQSYYEEDSESDIIRVKRYQQVKLLNARAGHVIYGLNA